jgi:hypothetical protein
MKRIVLSYVLAVLGLSNSAMAQPQALNVKITGGQAVYVPLDKAGSPASSLPGVKFISSATMAQMKGPTDSGLFVVDGQMVPASLGDQLKSQKYRLSPDGTLTDDKGEKLAAYVHSLTYKLATKKQGELPGALDRFAAWVGNALIPPAYAGNPYPFDCFTTNLWAVYQLRDFHRWQQAHTYAEANGSLPDGTCGPGRPLTAIDSIQVRAGFTNAPSSPALTVRSCRNCQRASVMRQNDYGFFWPAIGALRTNVHQINMFDPSGRGRWDFYIEWRR